MTCHIVKAAGDRTTGSCQRCGTLWFCLHLTFSSGFISSSFLTVVPATALLFLCFPESSITAACFCLLFCSVQFVLGSTLPRDLEMEFAGYSSVLLNKLGLGLKPTQPACLWHHRCLAQWVLSNSDPCPNANVGPQRYSGGYGVFG